MKVRKVIISRGRAKTITTHHLIPECTIVVPASEVEDYEVHGKKVVAIPDSIIGIAKVRNWVLDNIPDKILYMIDDDLRSVSCISGVRKYDINRADIVPILDNTAQCAIDIGANLFGFEIIRDPRQYDVCEPFNLVAWIAGCIGIRGRDIRFDERLRHRGEDLDFSLQHLLKNRYIWRDSRYAFTFKMNDNAGGNSLFRTEEGIALDDMLLKEKWRKHLRLSLKGNMPTITVHRKQTGIEL